MTVSTTTTAVSAAGDGSTTDFTFTFEILAASDLRVIVVTDSTGAESEKTLTTDYTVAGVGQVNGGTVTFVTAPASGETVHIKRGNMALTQPTNYTPNDPFPAETHENALDRVALQIQQINEKLGRAIVRSETDSASAQLPINETIKGKTLAFNETTGAVEAGPSVADVGTVSGIAADIATLADIEDGTDATDAIQTVASISGNVSTVAGISSDVTNVSNNAANVSTVASDSSNIATVSGNISDVNTVSSNITSVNTVATNIADVITVANDLNEAISEVETVANDLNEAVSEIDTVAGSISNVDTVGTNIANINTVAGISGNVTTVAGISSNVTTVAGVSADVTTVAGISANVTTVAGISSNVSTVAGISSDVTTVAGVSANVTTVSTDITNVNTVATNIADVNNFALTYRIAASAPATSLDEGDLYFDTTQNKMFVYDGSAWVTVSPDLVADTTPQLGGDLDLNGSDITGTGNINNTGTITTDGLTVDGNIALNGITTFTDSNVRLDLMESDTTDVNSRLQSSSGSMLFRTINDSKSSATTRMEINNSTGDISFYDSTGVSQNFLWDSSASRLTLSSSDYHFGIQQGGNQAWYLRGVSDGSFRLHLNGTGDIVTATASGIDVTGSVTADGLTVDTNTLYVDSTNNRVGIGTASPSAKAHIQTASSGSSVAGSGDELFVEGSGDAGITIGAGNTSKASLFFADNVDNAAGRIRYDHSDNSMQFGTNGQTERMRIDSSGNLLVGGTSAAEAGALTVYPTGIVQARVIGSNAIIADRTSTDGEIIDLRQDGTTVGSIGVRSGNLQIGTDDVGLEFHDTDNTIYPANVTTQALPDGTISFGSAASRFNNLYLSGTVTAGEFVADSAGSLGNDQIMLDFSAPAGRLRVKNSSGSPAANMDFYTTDTGGNTRIRQRVGYGGDISFYDSTGVTQGLFWDASTQSLGLGTSSPTAKIQTNTTSAGAATVGLFLNNESDTINTEVRLAFAANANNDIASNRYSYISAINTSGVNGQALSFATNQTGASAVEAMRISSSGDVLVGVEVTPDGSDTGVALMANGNFNQTKGSNMMNLYRGGTGSVVTFRQGTIGGSFTSVGTISVTGSATAYNTSSDYRLKENVTADWDATTRLKQLNPVRFNFIADPDTTVDGFLAHEVQDIVPEAISGTKDEVDADGNAVMQGIDQSKLVPLLVKTIQELEARIAALEAN